MEEWFDVVDAANRVVGRALREEVHAGGLRHRAAHVLLFDWSGRLYLQRRALAKDCSPGLWDSSAAGHLACGEDYRAAARRELAEELGVTVSAPLEALFLLAAAPVTGHEFIQVFAARSAQPVRPDPREIMAGRWLEPAALTAWLAREPEAFTGSFRLIWERFQARSAQSPAAP